MSATPPQKTALITGMTGFVGGHLARHLLAEGWQLHGVVRHRSSLEGIPPHMIVHRHDGRTEGMAQIFQTVQPDVVFHLASLFLAQHSLAEVSGLIESNLLFATQLVEAMTRQGVRHLVNTGTFWQHSGPDGREPVNLYAATKQAFEAILSHYVVSAGLRVITLKLSDTYGPRDPRKKLLPLLLQLAGEGAAPLAMSPGEQEMDIVHIEDVVRAFHLAAERLLAGEVAGHEQYAVSSGAPVTLRQLVVLFEQALGRPLPIRWGERSYRPREVMQTWRQGLPLPGWHPAIGLAEGFARLLQDDCR